jgi:putative glutamine amidotransferase
VTRAVPIVAVPAYHLGPGRVSSWHVGGYGVPENYVDAVRRAGGRPLLVLPGDERSPAELLEGTDALLLIGGGDVEPSRYGQEPSETIYGVEPDRDDLELELLRESDRREVPTLCVCRGMQLMNVAFGGSLIQDLPSDGRFTGHGSPAEAPLLHDVKLAEGSRIAEAAGTDVAAGASHHHQGLDRLGEGLVATAWSEDGLIEAIERERGWMVGAQWHPEETAAGDPAQQGLFDELVRLASAR